MIFIISFFLLLSRMKVIHIDKTFYPSTAIFQPKTLPALPVKDRHILFPFCLTRQGLAGNIGSYS